MNLSVDQGLSNLLLLGKSLSFLGPLKMLKGIPLLGVLLNSSILFFFLDCYLSLNLEKFLVCLLILISLSGSGLSASELLLLLSLKLFLDLFLDELALQLVLLDPLDEGHLEVLELRLNVLGVLHLLLVLLLQLLSEAFIVLRHLLLLELFPLKVDLLGEGLALLFVPSLDLLFGQDIGEEHLGVEGFHHILVIMEHLVGLIKLLLAEVLLVSFFLGVDAATFNLINTINN